MYNFMINGNPRWCREVTDTRMSVFFNIYGGVSHLHDCPNDDFRLTSNYFQLDKMEIEDIYKVGYELVSLFMGVQNILQIDNSRLELKQLLNEDATTLEIDVDQSCSIFELNKEFPNNLYFNEINKLHNSSNRYLCILIAALKREDIYIILKYYDDLGRYKNSDWGIYYKIVEAVGNFSKLSNNMVPLNIDKSLERALGNMANNFSQTALGSRHGYTKEQKKGKNTLSLDDAHRFVSHVTKQYINIVLSGIIAGFRHLEFELPMPE